MHIAPPTSLFLLPFAAVLSLSPDTKPCAAPEGMSQEALLAQAEIARGLAGTEAVGLDPSRSCITIAVRTPGTARLVKLMLRGMGVPASAVRFQVDSSAVPARTALRS